VLGEEPVPVSLYLPEFHMDGPGIEAGPPLHEAGTNLLNCVMLVMRL
jgi:hypothetical protein